MPNPPPEAAQRAAGRNAEGFHQCGIHSDFDGQFGQFLDRHFGHVLEGRSDRLRSFQQAVDLGVHDAGDLVAHGCPLLRGILDALDLGGSLLFRNRVELFLLFLFELYLLGHGDARIIHFRRIGRHDVLFLVLQRVYGLRHPLAHCDMVQVQLFGERLLLGRRVGFKCLYIFGIAGKRLLLRGLVLSAAAAELHLRDLLLAALACRAAGIFSERQPRLIEHVGEGRAKLLGLLPSVGDFLAGQQMILGDHVGHVVALEGALRNPPYGPTAGVEAGARPADAFSIALPAAPKALSAVAVSWI